MNSPVKKIVIKLLRELADNLDSGNTNLTEDEAVAIMNTITHVALSKEEACRFLNLSRSRFDDLVREGRLPRGRKRVGFKELFWYKDELGSAIARHLD